METFFKIAYAITGLTLLLSFVIGPYLMYYVHNNVKKIKYDLIEKHETIQRETNDAYLSEIDRVKTIYKNDIEMMKRKYDEKVESMHYTELSLDDVETVVNSVIQEIWTNKYYLNYYIRNVVIIPKMPEEISDMTKDVYAALSPNVKINALKYYTNEYFLQKIIRQTEMHFMEYTKQHRPPSK